MENKVGSPSQIVGATGVFDSTGKKLWSYIRAGTPASADLIPEIPGVEVVVTGGGQASIGDFDGNKDTEIASRQVAHLQSSIIAEIKLRATSPKIVVPW